MVRGESRSPLPVGVYRLPGHLKKCLSGGLETGVNEFGE